MPPSGWPTRTNEVCPTAAREAGVSVSLHYFLECKYRINLIISQFFHKTMYKIKQLPEDFIVRERLSLNLIEDGQYSYYLLKKRDYSTFDAIEQVAKKLRVNPKFINAAGLKDRHAETEQYISINKGQRKDFEVGKDLSLKYLGSGNERLNIGTLEGNEFEIVVRNLTKGFKLKKITHVINYFDEQRFGRDADNHIIGRMLVKKEFREAAVELEKKGNKEITEYLKTRLNDYVGALRTIPKKVLRFYVTSYQSYLWNECVKEYFKSVKDIGKDDTFPELGFDVEEQDRSRQEIIEKLLKSEGIRPVDFINRQIQELTLECQERRIFAEISDLSFGKMEDDELNPGMHKIKAMFYLGKGSYATNAIRELFSEP
jgi:tRNA pseudouridine13 synthase